VRDVAFVAAPLDATLYSLVSMKEIAAALVKAQTNFAPALKSSTNPLFRTKYADLAACIGAVIEALNNAEIALMQTATATKEYVTVETRLLHVSGEEITGGALSLPIIKADPQGIGSAITYARRYSLMATLGIAGEDDDGNDASRHKKDVEPDALPSNLAAMYSAAETAATSEQLQAAWKAGAHALMGHTEEYRKFKNAVLLRKAQILKASGDAAHA